MPEIITASGVYNSAKQRLPRQFVRRGKVGYVGEDTGAVEVYDPAHPNIRYADPGEDEETEKKERRRPVEDKSVAGPATGTEEEVVRRRRRRTT